MALWFLLVQTSKESAIVEHVCAISLINWIRQRSKSESIRRTTVQEEKGRGASGKSLNICWNAGDSIAVNATSSVTTHRSMFCSNRALVSHSVQVWNIEAIECCFILLEPSSPRSLILGFSKILCLARCVFMLVVEVALAESVVFQPQ